MDDAPTETHSLSPADRRACILFVLLLLGLFAADLVYDYQPVKLTVLFIAVFWFPLLLLNELAHVLMARALGWRVLGVAFGFGPLLTRFSIRGAPVQIRLIPFESFVLPVPLHLRQYRLRGALIYGAGPLAELLLLGMVVSLCGWDALLQRTEDYGLLAAQSLAVAAVVSTVLTLVPHSVGIGYGKENLTRIANDGLGVVRCVRMSERYFAELAQLGPEDVLREFPAPEKEDEED
jgi:hypothetical protein